MALCHREEFWLDPSYPRISTQDALDEAWRLIAEDEEEEEGESNVHVNVDSGSSKNDAAILAKSKSKIRSGLQKVAKQLVSPGSGLGLVSSLLRLGRSRKSNNNGASSSSGSSSSATECPQSSACQELASADYVVPHETKRLFRDSAASASSSSTGTSDEASTEESSFEADSSTSSVAAAPPEKTVRHTVVSPPIQDFLTMEPNLPVVFSVVPKVGKVEQRFLASFMKRKKEPKKSTPLPVALCFPVLWP
ncbi:unnamed protein product [Linum trigynum]|uniref:Uncharacterized protein n=1 Tax=Linum trigynum TaxID=586398 RepID=A0AAV2DIP9_9ROSI